jgi:hypothetical protein
MQAGLAAGDRGYFYGCILDGGDIFEIIYSLA